MSIQFKHFVIANLRYLLQIAPGAVQKGTLNAKIVEVAGRITEEAHNTFKSHHRRRFVPLTSFGIGG